jgi:hypothetical protein
MKPIVIASGINRLLIRMKCGLSVRRRGFLDSLDPYVDRSTEFLTLSVCFHFECEAKLHAVLKLTQIYTFGYLNL